MSSATYSIYCRKVTRLCKLLNMNYTRTLGKFIIQRYFNFFLSILSKFQLILHTKVHFSINARPFSRLKLLQLARKNYQTHFAISYTCACPTAGRTFITSASRPRTVPNFQKSLRYWSVLLDLAGRREIYSSLARLSRSTALDCGRDFTKI